MPTLTLLFTFFLNPLSFSSLARSSACSLSFSSLARSLAFSLSFSLSSLSYSISYSFSFPNPLPSSVYNIL